MIGVPIGIFSAVKANSWIDTVNMGIMLVLFAIPSFVLAVYVQIIIVWLDTTTNLGWPVAGWGNTWQYGLSDIQSKLLPILVLVAAGLAYFARIARTSMLEVLRQDYVRSWHRLTRIWCWHRLTRIWCWHRLTGIWCWHRLTGINRIGWHGCWHRFKLGDVPANQTSPARPDQPLNQSRTTGQKCHLRPHQ